MRRLALLLATLFLLSGCVTATYVLNQPKPSPVFRPLDMPNIFSSERVRVNTPMYARERVIFLADISTSEEKQFEAFLANRDGTNPIRLTFSGAARVGTAFEDEIFFVLSNGNPHIPGWLSRPFTLSFFDDSGKKMNALNDVHEICHSPDKSQLALLQPIVASADRNEPLALYLLDRNMQRKKLADLPPKVGVVQPGIFNRYEALYGSMKSFNRGSWYDIAEMKALEWQTDQMILKTEEALGPNGVYRFKIYALSIPEGNGWSLIKKWSGEFGGY